MVSNWNVEASFARFGGDIIEAPGSVLLILSKNLGSRAWTARITSVRVYAEGVLNTHTWSSAQAKLFHPSFRL